MSEFLFFQETASSGNGGGAMADSNGGAISSGTISSGGNMGTAVGVGDTMGSVSAGGGSMANTTDVALDADGGTSIADASGGDYNVAFVS